MLDETKKYFESLLNLYQGKPDLVVKNLLSSYSSCKEDSLVKVFLLCRKLGIRIIVSDFDNDISQFIERGKDSKSYITLNSRLDCKKLRYNCAVMLYCALNSKNNTQNFINYDPNNNDNFHKAEIFALNLLMPTNELKNLLFSKNEKNEYRFLIKEKEKDILPLKNIPFIAKKFGVDIDKCIERILLTDLVKIENIENIKSFYKNKKELDFVDDVDDALEYKLKSELIDNMHYPNINTASSAVRTKIRIESLKNDCLIEGVIKDTKDIDRFLAKYRHDSDSVFKELYKLSLSQRMVIGHYETLLHLEENEFNKSIFNVLHEGIFKYAVMQPGENEYLEQHPNLRPVEVFLDFKPGNYRRTRNIVSGASFTTEEPERIYSVIENLYYDMADLLKDKDKISNVAYINRVNYIANRFLVCHPFEDGNGRVSRLIMNYLFIKKGLPPFYINATERKKEYIKALNDLKDDVREKAYDKINYQALNNVVMDSLLEIEGYFYTNKAMLIDPNKTIDKAKKVK